MVVDAGLEVERAPGLAFLHHHVIERVALRQLSGGAVQLRRQERPLVRVQLPGEGRVHRGQHVLRHDVGEEPEAPAVDAEHRHAVARDQARGVQQRAVTADGDDQVGTLAKHPFRDACDRGGVGREHGLLTHQHLHAPAGEVRQQRAHAHRDARIRESAY